MWTVWSCVSEILILNHHVPLGEDVVDTRLTSSSSQTSTVTYTELIFTDYMMLHKLV